MSPVTRFLGILAVIFAAAALHAVFMDLDMPLATGIAFMLAMWGGRVWQKIEDAR